MYPLERHLILIGGRGVGKSTISVAMATQYGLRQISTDELVISHVGRTIPELVQEQGWSTFRLFEQAALENALAQKPSVIDTGGGIVCWQDAQNTQFINQRNIDMMQRLGVVIWLQQDVELQKKRITGATHIPSLSGSREAAEELEAIMALRAPWYAAAAHVSVRLDTIDPEQLVPTIWQHYLAHLRD